MSAVRMCCWTERLGASVQLAKAAGVTKAGLDHFYKVLRVTAQYELCAPGPPSEVEPPTWLQIVPCAHPRLGAPRVGGGSCAVLALARDLLPSGQQGVLAPLGCVVAAVWHHSSLLCQPLGG